MPVPFAVTWPEPHLDVSAPISEGEIDALAERLFAGIERGKVLVAMSGGVDSSVAAALLVRAGFDCVGCFMRLGTVGEDVDETCETGSVRLHHRGCCSVGDAADARTVAATLGIEFHALNFRDDFGRVIDYFVDEYANGRTPNPCVRCNDWLKFGRLHEQAKQLGARYVASGHYARIARAGASGPRLLRGVDHTKDQSYVLFGVGRAQLDEMLLPVGELEKSVVRDLARALNLPVFDKPDSQEICFVPDDDYAGLVERRRPELGAGARGKGVIRDADGAEVGQHDGHHKFTVGQRRGVGVALGHPIYVIETRPAANEVRVGTADELLVGGCVAGEPNWLTPTDPAPTESWHRCRARCRYNGVAVPAEYRVLGAESAPSGPTPSGRPGGFEVRFDEPVRAVAPGQAVVIYDDQNPDLVLGGGWIARAFRDGDPSGTIPHA
ncbi:MAG: tRNA-specific 2-thiouridylase MnmA [Phycisphaeraceae bacterium]|nr:MAG: tRNA-specific 2-thiouridylase MnmA [Phycisphaeraceae bacterium]